MANSLQSLFQAIAQTRDEQELRLHVMVRIGEYFEDLSTSFAKSTRLEPPEDVQGSEEKPKVTAANIHEELEQMDLDRVEDEAMEEWLENPMRK